MGSIHTNKLSHRSTATTTGISILMMAVMAGLVMGLVAEFLHLRKDTNQSSNSISTRTL